MTKLRHFPHIMLIIALGIWIAACAPAGVDLVGPASGPDETFANTESSSTNTESSAGSGETSTDTESSAGDTITSNQAGQVSGPSEPPSFERPAVDNTTQSSEGNQAAGQSGAADAPGDASGAQAETMTNQDAGSEPSDTMTNLDTNTWQVYTDSTYGFRVLYPPAFAVKPAASGDVLFGATAVATVQFVDMQNEMAEIAPPPFTVRIFDVQQGQSLAAWLEGNRLIGGEANVDTEPFQTGQIDGVRVNSRDFMAPGWSVYVLRGTHVFQLVPLGAEGETMLGTFAFL